MQPVLPDDSGSQTVSRAGTHASDQDLLTTLFALGREVTSVLDLDELLHTIPNSSRG